MILREVMARLTAQAMPPLRLVQGLAEFEALAAPPGDPALPAAYVVPGVTQGSPNNLVTGFRQRLAEPFSVVLLHRNRRDARGAAAALDLSDHVIPAIRRALLGWQPTPAWEPVEIRQGRLIDSTDGILAWRDDFTTATQHRV